MNGAGGIRTHGLELMRLAGTAAPLPRVAPMKRSGRQESNLRSPAPEAGGVATLPYDQTSELWEEGLPSLNRCRALVDAPPEASVACRHACQPPS